MHVFFCKWKLRVFENDSTINQSQLLFVAFNLRDIINQGNLLIFLPRKNCHYKFTFAHFLAILFVVVVAEKKEEKLNDFD